VTLKDWHKRCVDQHRAQVAAGRHDDQCEWAPTGFFLCHCSKRRREAKGHGELPKGELYFPPPMCPRCDRDVEHNGDSWTCPACSIVYDDRGEASMFTDDYGPDLAAERRKHDEQVVSKEAAS
jgi:hypothetical protein